MRTFFLFLATIVTFFAIILTILPTEKLGILASIFGVIFAILAFKKSSVTQKKLPKGIVIVALITGFVALGFVLFSKSDVVAVDQQFEQKKIESKKEDVKDLEGLE